MARSKSSVCDALRFSAQTLHELWKQNIRDYNAILCVNDNNIMPYPLQIHEKCVDENSITQNSTVLSINNQLIHCRLKHLLVLF